MVTHYQWNSSPLSPQTRPGFSDPSRGRGQFTTLRLRIDLICKLEEDIFKNLDVNYDYMLRSWQNICVLKDGMGPVGNSMQDMSGVWKLSDALKHPVFLAEKMTNFVNLLQKR